MGKGTGSMSEDRLTHIELMLTELIRITGNTNSIVEELRLRVDNIETAFLELNSDVSTLKSDVATLKSDVAILKSDVTALKSDVATLKSDVAVLKSDVATLKSDVAELKAGQKRIEADIETIKENHLSLFEVFGEHDVAIRNLRRRIV